MQASHRVWILLLLLVPIYGAGCAAAFSWALLQGLPEGVAVLGPGDLAWRYVYAAQVAAVLTLGPLTLGLANLTQSLQRSLEALVAAALLMQLMAWWALTSPLDLHAALEGFEGLDGIVLSARAEMESRALGAASRAWLVASALLPFTLARDDLRRGVVGYAGALLIALVPAVLFTPPDVISTLLTLGLHLGVATAGFLLGTGFNRLWGSPTPAGHDKA